MKTLVECVDRRVTTEEYLYLLWSVDGGFGNVKTSNILKLWQRNFEGTKYVQKCFQFCPQHDLMTSHDVAIVWSFPKWRPSWIRHLWLHAFFKTFENHQNWSKNKLNQRWFAQNLQKPWKLAIRHWKQCNKNKIKLRAVVQSTFLRY